jgi:hypothetical protein
MNLLSKKNDFLTVAAVASDDGEPLRLCVLLDFGADVAILDARFDRRDRLKLGLLRSRNIDSKILSPSGSAPLRL